MIKNLHIQNFKSIKDLKLDCSRVNVFIGEPNTGKSNILETLSLRSSFYNGYNIKPFVRFEKTTNLFYDNIIEKAIVINYDDSNVIIKFENSKFKIELTKLFPSGLHSLYYIFYDYEKIVEISERIKEEEEIKCFLFKQLDAFTGLASDFLRPPFGDNLYAILESKNNIYDFSADLLSTYGYDLILRTGENKIEIAKKIGRKLITFPYPLIADTLQRVIFYYTAMETNKNSILVFEEPESHIFPFYNKFLAEKIALYNTNQFFIATHNPTFLLNLIEQTPDEELTVFITYYDKENYETKVYPLKGKDTDKLLEYGSSLFMNLDRIYEKK